MCTRLGAQSSVGSPKSLKQNIPCSKLIFISQLCFAWQAKGIRDVLKYMAGAGICEGCEKYGSRSGCEEGRQECIFHGRHSVLSSWTMMSEAGDAQFVVPFLSVPNILIFRHHFARQVRDFVCLYYLYSWQAQHFKHLTFKMTNSGEPETASELSTVNMSSLKEVSHQTFV